MSDLLNIHEVSERLGCSEKTIRSRMKKRLIPQPIKRKSTGETLQWRKHDIDAFLGIEPQEQSAVGKAMEDMISKIADRRIQLALQQYGLV